MLMSALHLLDTEPDPDRPRIREEMSGGICRCTGYQGIVDAVEAAAATLRDGDSQVANTDASGAEDTADGHHTRPPV
jgi:xanthine dehydrogenase iron-sulfur cluster and FAD-binding subunit A